MEAGRNDPLYVLQRNRNCSKLEIHDALASGARPCTGHVLANANEDVGGNNMTQTRRLNDVIEDLEDVKTSLEEVDAGVHEPSEVHQATKDLEKATDKLEEIVSDEEEEP